MQNIVYDSCLFLTFSIIHVLFYALMVTSYPLSTKQKASIITNTTSCLLSMLGLVLNLQYFQLITVTQQFYDSLARVSVLLFMSYLLVDLVLGTMYYKNYMTWLVGYVHHTIYMILCWSYFLPYHASVSALFFVEEIPTFILNIAKLNPQYRHDLMFGTMFFVWRIFYHSIMTLHFANNQVIFWSGVTAFPLHLHLFVQWYKLFTN